MYAQSEQSATGRSQATLLPALCESSGRRVSCRGAAGRRAGVAMRLEQLDRDARLLAHERPEVPRRHAPADDVRLRADRRRAVAAGEQRDLPEVVARPERRRRCLPSCVTRPSPSRRRRSRRRPRPPRRCGRPARTSGAAWTRRSSADPCRTRRRRARHRAGSRRARQACAEPTRPPWDGQPPPAPAGRPPWRAARRERLAFTRGGLPARRARSRAGGRVGRRIRRP